MLRRPLNWIIRGFFWINILSDIWTGYLFWSVLVETFGFVFQQVKSSRISPLYVAYPFLSCVLIPITYEFIVNFIGFGIILPIIVLMLQFLAWFACYLRNFVCSKLGNKEIGAFPDIAAIKSWYSTFFLEKHKIYTQHNANSFIIIHFDKILNQKNPQKRFLLETISRENPF